MKLVTTTFYLNGRIKTYNSDSESQNLMDFLNDYSEAKPELFVNNNKVITSIQREGNVTKNYKYRTRDELNNFLSFNFKSEKKMPKLNALQETVLAMKLERQAKAREKTKTISLFTKDLEDRLIANHKAQDGTKEFKAVAKLLILAVLVLVSV